MAKTALCRGSSSRPTSRHCHGEGVSGSSCHLVVTAFSRPHCHGVATVTASVIPCDRAPGHCPRHDCACLTRTGLYSDRLCAAGPALHRTGRRPKASLHQSPPVGRSDICFFNLHCRDPGRLTVVGTTLDGAATGILDCRGASPSAVVLLLTLHPAAPLGERDPSRLPPALRVAALRMMTSLDPVAKL
jgi:hypothetical protein